jgi:hypothetical protein
VFGQLLARPAFLLPTELMAQSCKSPSFFFRKASFVLAMGRAQPLTQQPASHVRLRPPSPSLTPGPVCRDLLPSQADADVTFLIHHRRIPRPIFTFLPWSTTGAI